MTIPDKPNYSHGSTGEEPETSIDYQNGDPVDESEFDYFIYTEFHKIGQLIDYLEDVDGNGDGVVDEADSANNYKNNDIDSNGDGKVDAADQADNATLVKDNDIDSDGDGRVDAADDAITVKGNDIDNDGDGKVNAADDADTVGGEPPSNFADTNHGNEEHDNDFTTLAEVNASADVPHADFADEAGNGVPEGVIVMWSGTTSDVPSGWTLCDGSDGTPDLRDRFVVGAGSSYGSGETGGSETVGLSKSEMPRHDHGGGDHTHTTDAVKRENTEQVGVEPDTPVISEDSPGATIDSSGEIIDSVGSGEAHENRPPYFALAFIMKL